jgi:hypothetical protein
LFYKVLNVSIMMRVSTIALGSIRLNSELLVCAGMYRLLTVILWLTVHYVIVFDDTVLSRL